MSSEKVMVVVAGERPSPAEVARLRELSSSGARIIAWQHPPIVQDRFPSPDVAGALERLGLLAVPLASALGEKASDEVDEAVIAWMKGLGRVRLGPAGSFRDIFRYGRLSLWWWAELFLYHDTPLRLLVRDIEALSRLLEREQPERLVLFNPVRGLDRAAGRLASRVEIWGRPPRVPLQGLQTSVRWAANLLKMAGTAAKSAGRRLPSRKRGSGRFFLFLTHASMWRERREPETGESELAEMYFDRILPALSAEGEEVQAIAVGPPVPFKQRDLSATLKDVLELEAKPLPYVPLRRYFHPGLFWPLARAQFGCWRDWRRFRRLPSLGEALAHRGVPLGREAFKAFRDTFLLQIPWAIRSYHELREVLARERPDVLVLYAESSGLGRAAVAAACDAGVPSFAIQHGIMYPRYYSHEHAADEVSSESDGGDSCPLPTRTAVFGSLARDLLVERGHYPPERIVITGSPKFDALVKAAGYYNKSEIRSRLGLCGEEPVLVVASRFSAIGPVFRDLVKAAKAICGLWLLVKPHQAERPEPYLEIVAAEEASRVRVLPREENLLELILASDGLVTVDSLASSEALVVGRPVLVVNLPSNLEPLVERGVALGARNGEDLTGLIERLLHDGRLRSELEDRRRAYIREFAFGADGGSTGRIVQALRETAELGKQAILKAPEVRGGKVS